jgi:hypothetical protein
MAKIEHRVGVHAPPDTIWGLIYDVPGWAAWNPLYPRAEGAVHIGSQLTLTQALPGRAQQTIRPTVLEWVPNEQLHWRASHWGGLATSVRYVEIEKLAEESCIVSTGEIFSGLLGDWVAGQSGRTLHRGFRQMNEALKSRAEELWREQSAATTS